MQLCHRNVVSVFVMLSFTLFLAFMDLKDLYYKILMTGPVSSWSFTSDIHETITTIDLTAYLKQNPPINPGNKWNTLAMNCESLFLTKLVGKVAHLGAVGKGCRLGQFHFPEEILFMGSMRVDALIWASGLLRDAIHKPMPMPNVAAIYSTTYLLPERKYRDDLAGKLNHQHSMAIDNSTKSLLLTFGQRQDTWEDVLCFEMMKMPGKGTVERIVTPSEYGCIWGDAFETISFYSGQRSGAYFRMLSEWVGWNWHTVDYLWVNSIYIRSTLRMVSKYRIDLTENAKINISHIIQMDLSVDGILYYFMLMVEIMIIYINIGDSTSVAIRVVTPLLYTFNSNRKPSRSSASIGPIIHCSQDTKASTSSLKTSLLYTDLSSVSFTNWLLCLLLVLDTFLSWIYIIPNSVVFAWSTSTFQIVSALASTFRIWPVIIILMNRIWQIFVLCNERAAYAINQYVQISGYQVMTGTIVSVFVNYYDVLNLCLLKWSLDRQREMTLTTPGLYSFYNSYSMYTYGDRSTVMGGLSILYGPLLKIVSGSVFYSFVVGVIKACGFILQDVIKRNFKPTIKMALNNYTRTTIEEATNVPMRAMALIRSQRKMDIKFGKKAFVRPFIYLEQGYHVLNGEFGVRNTIPLNSTVRQSFDVDTKAYSIKASIKKGVNEMDNIDIQLPLG